MPLLQTVAVAGWCVELYLANREMLTCKAEVPTSTADSKAYASCWLLLLGTGIHVKQLFTVTQLKR